MVKLCSKCQVTKGVTEFHKRGTKWQPMCKSCKKERSEIRYAEKGEAIRACNKAWRAANPDKMQYARDNWSPPKGYFTEARAHGRALAYGCLVVDRDVIRVFYEQCPEGMEVDHIKPLSKGGDHSISNIQYLNPHDNRVKAAKWEEL